MSAQRTRGGVFSSVITLAIFIVLLSSCTKAVQDESAGSSSFAQVAVSLDSSRFISQGGMSAMADLLPENLCYIIHVTGPGLTAVGDGDAQCGPEVGLGMISARSYNVGDTAQLEVEPGLARRFDLIGFTSPNGTSAEGKGNCGAISVYIEPNPYGAGRKVKLLQNNEPITAKPVLFYTGTADLVSGPNVVALAKVPLFASPITASLTFGKPYNREDVAAVAACQQSFGTNAQLKFATGGRIPAQIVAPGGATLKGVTVTPFIMNQPRKTSAAGGGVSLGTGFYEIIRTGN